MINSMQVQKVEATDGEGQPAGLCAYPHLVPSGQEPPHDIVLVVGDRDGARTYHLGEHEAHVLATELRSAANAWETMIAYACASLDGGTIYLGEISDVREWLDLGVITEAKVCPMTYHAYQELIERQETSYVWQRATLRLYDARNRS